MQIISAIDYGYRVVLRVCLNPEDPNWVHVVGDQERDVHGLPVFTPDGRPVLITDPSSGPGETGEVCHNCRQNWVTTEVILEGADLYGEGIDGEPVRLSDDDLAVTAFARTRSYASPRVLSGIVGRGD